MIVSDDAGQFRIGNHVLCWVHCERLLQKLMPARTKEVRSVALVRDLVWRFYKALKAWKKRPSPSAIPAFRQRFDRIFTLRTDYDALDALLVRLHRRKAELLRVLNRPEIPLHTNASENDLRTFVTKRKISGGTMSRDGRVARDAMLGLMKTCQKQGLSFYHYLGDRLGIRGRTVPPLAGLIAYDGLQNHQAQPDAGLLCRDRSCADIVCRDMARHSGLNDPYDHRRDH